LIWSLNIAAVHDLLVLATQEQGGVRHLFGIIFAADETDAGRRAAANLVLQTGPVTMRVVAVFAVADPKQFLDQIDALAHGTCRGIGPEIAVPAPPGTPVKSDLGKIVAGRQYDPGIGFVVPQQDVVTRLEGLDPLVLQQQRFTLGPRQAYFHFCNLGDHPHDAVDLRPSVEIRGHALAQVARLADIQGLTRTVTHQVNPGSSR
jgi:hypothetical protein